jgi:hypothetical protein
MSCHKFMNSTDQKLAELALIKRARQAKRNARVWEKMAAEAIQNGDYDVALRRFQQMLMELDHGY